MTGIPLVGSQLKEMITQITDGKISEAARLHHSLLPLIKALFLISNPIPVKYALNYIGFRVGKTRLPLTEPDENTAAAIRDALKDCQIDLPLA